MVWFLGVYNANMTMEQLLLLHAARPFQPFDIHLSDGRTLPVKHPELLSRSPDGQSIAVALPDDTIETIDLSLVKSVKPRGQGVGRRGRRRS